MVSIPNVPSDARQAVIYDRVSTGGQVAGYSSGGDGYQVAACRRLAAEMGAEVLAEISDVDSGTLWDLPGLNRVLRMAKARDFDTLICHDPDRFARSLTKQMILTDELRRFGVAVRFFTVRADDTPEGRMLVNMKGVFSEYEREKILFRTANGRRRKAERGHIVGNGGVPPYGYTFRRHHDDKTNTDRIVGLEPDPLTAPVVERIFRSARTDSFLVIARSLEADAIPTARGGTRWDANVVAQIVASPVYVGRAQYADVTVACPALVDEATFDDAREQAHRRKTVQRARLLNAAADPFTLRALLTCGHCGGCLAINSDKGVRAYTCQRHRLQEGRVTCPMMPIHAVTLERFAWDQVATMLLDEDRLTEGLVASQNVHADQMADWDARRATLDREIAKKRGTMKRLLLDRAESERGTAEWQEAAELIKDVEATVNRLENERAKVAPREPVGLSAEAAADLKAFAATIRAGIGAANADDQKKVYALLRLRATVYMDDAAGIKMRQRRLRIDWQAEIGLGNGRKTVDNESGFVKLLLMYQSGAEPGTLVCRAGTD